MQTSGIYLITNMVNGKRYVGKAARLKARQRFHRRALIRGTHTNPHLQRAWNAFGEASFSFSVLEYCERSMLVERECWWINALDLRNSEKGYNILHPVTGRLGMKSSPQTKAKISAANKGRIHTPEARARMSLGAIGRVRPPMSPETRAKIAIANTGKKHSPEVLARVAAANTGKKHSDEHKAKIAAAMAGKPKSPEARAKLSAAKKGKSFSPEHRSNLSLAHQGKPWSDIRRAAYERKREQQAEASEPLVS
jgi:group I intron endonuclease